MTRALDIIDSLRETTLSPEQETLLNELEPLVKQDVLWPAPVIEAAVEVFGPSIHNVNGRTHGVIDRRVRHALRAWRIRYAMNAEQYEYAGLVLAAAIRYAKNAPKQKDVYAYAQTRLTQMVNDETVHAGMQRRAALVDVSDMMTAAFG